MRWLPVFKKEMRLYFGSPVAYAVATFFLFIAAFFLRANSSSVIICPVALSKRSLL